MCLVACRALYLERAVRPGSGLVKLTIVEFGRTPLVYLPFANLKSSALITFLAIILTTQNHKSKKT